MLDPLIVILLLAVAWAAMFFRKPISAFFARHLAFSKVLAIALSLMLFGLILAPLLAWLL